MKTESEYGFVVKADNEKSESRETLWDHEHLQKFVLSHLIKFDDISDPDLDFGSDLDIEQAA